jgi:hypothetical protein
MRKAETMISPLQLLQEMDAASSRLIAGAGTLREFLVVSASIISDLCDELLPGRFLDEERFPTYEALCKYVRDYPISDGSIDFWEYYWDVAATVMMLYDRVPKVSDWDLHQEASILFHPDPDYPDQQMDSSVRCQVTETCYALTRWIRPETTHSETISFTDLEPNP